MRRWNGWGDESITVEPKPAAAAFLRERLGEGGRPRDVTLDEAAAGAPASRLAAHPLIAVDPRVRIRHARGQSLPDWIALRGGSIGVIPDGVACPKSQEDVRALIDHAAACGARLIPYGGGTSVVGHLTPTSAEAPILTVDLSGIAALERLDQRSQLATFGAGIAGPALEAALRPFGLTLGHFPQSFELSTLGGWIATRSSGQMSLRYGRIEDTFAGGTVEAPRGTFEIPVFPASAAGPDLRELVLGSEGRLGVITRAVVRVSRAPAAQRFAAFFLPEWAAAEGAVRELAQARAGLAMMRLSNPVETATQLALAVSPRLLRLLDGALRLRGLGAERCLLVVGAAGSGRQVTGLLGEVGALLRRAGGARAPGAFARAWEHGRFRNAYLRNSLWERGYAIDTVETALPWAGVRAGMQRIEAAATAALAAAGERGLVFSHLSHVYPTGSSVYSTFVFRIAADPAATLERWRRLKAAVSAAIVASGGTISHQHGVGRDHRAELVGEKGPLGIAAIDAALKVFDPDTMMNPGTLIG